MNRMIRGLLLLLAMAVLPLTPACAQGRRLQANDQMQVRVLNQPEFDAQVRIAPDGTASLPYIGRFRASGRTEDEVARLYRNALRSQKVVNDAQVVVSTATFGSQVTISGAVRAPGATVLDRPTTLAEALTRAGGASQTAGTIIVRRQARRGLQITRYDLRAVLAGSANPMVANGDQIYVEEASVYYLYGYVNRPGAYPLQRALTVQQALASGGGLAELGSESRIEVKRTRNGVVVQEPANLDQPVHANDTIIVKERWF